MRSSSAANTTSNPDKPAHQAGAQQPSSSYKMTSQATATTAKVAKDEPSVQTCSVDIAMRREGTQRQHARASNAQRIVGTAVMDDVLVTYLYDSGADETIVNEALFSRLQAKNPMLKLTPYEGPLVKSCSGPMVIRGFAFVRTCIIDPTDDKALRDVRLIVAVHKSSYECILGRDLISRVPRLR